ncbi:AAA family ATPase [Pseudooceanicola sp. 200-1SW]|uniref:AAA family ATPase n=1 Tax=Pseudooceanicola sp. 200-1SW TaxID=3425949 RepID=UPI003D7F30A0
MPSSPAAPPMLHLLCGKIASGKSTLAARLARRPGHLRLAEDDWLAALFGPEMTTGADYLHYAARLRSVMAPHVEALLGAGLSVVLDFPANTVEQRGWMRDLIARTGVAHELHLLTPPDAVCLARLRARNADADHPFAATEAQFHRFAAHFAPPGPDEGFTIRRHGTAG